MRIIAMPGIEPIALALAKAVGIMRAAPWAWIIPIWLIRAIPRGRGVCRIAPAISLVPGAVALEPFAIPAGRIAAIAGQRCRSAVGLMDRAGTDVFGRWQGVLVLQHWLTVIAIHRRTRCPAWRMFMRHMSERLGLVVGRFGAVRPGCDRL